MYQCMVPLIGIIHSSSVQPLHFAGQRTRGLHERPGDAAAASVAVYQRNDSNDGGNLNDGEILDKMNISKSQPLRVSHPTITGPL